MDPITLQLDFADGKQQEISISTMPVARFRRAWDACRPTVDELKMLDLACNQADGWSVNLTPESFGRACDAMYKVNPDFFGSVARRQAFASAAG